MCGGSCHPCPFSYRGVTLGPIRRLYEPRPPQSSTPTPRERCRGHPGLCSALGPRRTGGPGPGGVPGRRARPRPRGGGSARPCRDEPPGPGGVRHPLRTPNPLCSPRVPPNPLYPPGCPRTCCTPDPSFFQLRLGVRGRGELQLLEHRAHGCGAAGECVRYFASPLQWGREKGNGSLPKYCPCQPPPGRISLGTPSPSSSGNLVAMLSPEMGYQGCCG